MPLEVRLLGPLEIVLDDRPVRLTGRLRALLAVLALSAEKVVSVARIAEALWGDHLPANPRTSVQTYITRLRETVGHGLIHTQPPGYRLSAQVDAVRFEELLDRDSIPEALALWRGVPFEGTDSAWLEQVQAPRLTELYLTAVERLADRELAAGRHTEQIAPLRELLSHHPLRETLAARLITALDGAGRRAEALETYEATRRRIADELGTDPGPELRGLHAALLTEPEPEAVTAVIPRQLPPDLPGFAGRLADLSTLDGMLGGALSPLAITVISGIAGVGKTTLAVHWAHRVADRFPNGQLYVNLRGYDPGAAPVEPATAIRGFLDALGVPPRRIPADLAAQTALYRSLLSGRRMLMVLDNARDAEQVRPLLPGGTGCAAIVTSRDRLTGLIAAEGARPLALDLLTKDEAEEMLAQRLGPQRVTSERRAVGEIIDRCARLPLALAITAARAAANPSFPLDTLAAQLRESRGGLAVFEDGDTATDLRGVFSWSYRTLSEGAAALFRLIGLHPGPDISVLAAASLSGLGREPVRPLLSELTRANLLTERAPGRFMPHDLLRAYAAELAEAHDTDAARRAASRRVLDHYLHSAYLGARLLQSSRDPLELPPAEPGVTVAELATYDEALDWLTTEHQVLLAAVGHAMGEGLDTHAWQLAWSLTNFLYRRGFWNDRVAVGLAAVRAAERLGDDAVLALNHRSLAGAYVWKKLYDEALEHYDEALDFATRCGDRIAQAHIHEGLALLKNQLSDHYGSLDHSRRALELYTDAGHLPGQADALNQMAMMEVGLGDHRPAIVHCRQALALQRELDNPYGQAATWDTLGLAHHRLGAHAQAIICFGRSLRLLREIGERYPQTEVFINLGEANLAAGEPDAAEEAMRQALAILEELGHPDAEAVRGKLKALQA
ncbi:MAG TPA: BTAD domain-containing putative transcriptional regulator [Candidatus Limnocylindrales bacterium]